MFKKWFAKIQSISCYQASVLISQKLDHPLSLRQRIQLMGHLAVCDGCATIQRQLREMHLFLAQAWEQGTAQAFPPVLLNPQAKERIKTRLKEKS